MRQLLFLERIVQATAAGIGHTTLLQTIVGEATEAVAAEVCSIYLWDDTEKVLTLTATNGLSPVGIGCVKLGLGDGITGWVAAQRVPVAVRDVRYDSRFEWIQGIDQERFTSMLSVPILSGNRLIGVLNVQTENPRIFSDEETGFLLSVAAQIAGIIELSWRYQKASRELALERELAGIAAAPAGLGFASGLDSAIREPIRKARSALRQLSARLRHSEQSSFDEIDESLRRAELFAGRLHSQNGHGSSAA